MLTNNRLSFCVSPSAALFMVALAGGCGARTGLEVPGINDASVYLDSKISDVSTPQDGITRVPMFLRVRRFTIAPNVIDRCWSTDQGNVPFEPVDLPLDIDTSHNILTLPAFTSNTFILPQQRSDLNIMGDFFVTIPHEAMGTYDPATGNIEIQNVEILLTGAVDFTASVRTTLTTRRLNINTLRPLPLVACEPIHPHINDGVVFGDPIGNNRHVALVGAGVLTATHTIHPWRLANIAILIEGEIR